MGERSADTAWSYEEPSADAASIAGHVAFDAGRLACFSGAERASPQPGGFHVGWITDELFGPFEGDPHSGGW